MTRRRSAAALAALAVVMSGACHDADERVGSAMLAGQAGGAGEAGEEPGGAGGGGGKRSGAGGASKAGEPNTPGSGGAAGEPSSGGAEAAPNVVSGVDCRGERFEVDVEIVRRCVLLASCLGPDRGRVSSCIESWPRFTLYHLDLLGGVPLTRPFQFWPLQAACTDAPLQSCDDVLRCSGYRMVLDECDGAQSSRCEGELAIDCLEGEVTDCERFVGHPGACAMHGMAQSPECVSKASCTEPNGTLSCDTDVGYRCQNGVGYGLDCSQFGATCLELGGGAGCQDLSLPSKTCDTPGVFACDGDVMTYCSADGLLFEDDCAERGMTCLAEEAAGGAGGAASEAVRGLDCSVNGCELARAPDTCDGDDLILSLGMASGAGIVVHCPDYGFETCELDRCVEPLP